MSIKAGQSENAPGEQATPPGEGGQKKPEDTTDGKGAKDGPADGDGKDDGELDESALDPKTKSYIAKLRKEAAGHRTKANNFKTELDTFKQKVSKAVGGEEDDTPPEKKIEALTAHSNSLAVENGILALAVEHSVPKDGMKYFKFLIAEALDSLEEGEELDEEKLTPILAEVRGKAAKPTTTSVTANNGKKDPEASEEITLSKFCAMSMGEKTDLYRSKPDLYNSLLAQAKKEKRLV